MITIIDYNCGNLSSVANALKKIGVKYKISNQAEEIKNAKKVIFPGVGQAKFAMENLAKLNFIEAIKNLKTPFLGICLGLQLMAEYSKEGDTKCLSIIKGKVKKFPSLERIPQIGWNKVNFENTKKNPLLKDIPDQSYFYFVNSYYLPAENPHTLATSNYSINSAAILNYKNFYATQFHPEKSGEIGLRLLNNFCNL